MYIKQFIFLRILKIFHWFSTSKTSEINSQTNSNENPPNNSYPTEVNKNDFKEESKPNEKLPENNDAIKQDQKDKKQKSKYLLLIKKYYEKKPFLYATLIMWSIIILIGGLLITRGLGLY
ncbi:hypothetical protein [Mycoplasma amphoriforme]|uniref:Uncharacterized protein n=1 Tax=Mycoplasma amphoriforme A39 TaxID=572419 RepID=A0A292IH46_9MOLU|nr:unnamed protein product [Mycoplasma amphoriforme A39]